MHLVNVEQEREMSAGKYAFNNTWWSAPNFQTFLSNDDKNLQLCKDLKVVTQEHVYDTVGKKIQKGYWLGKRLYCLHTGLAELVKRIPFLGLMIQNRQWLGLIFPPRMNIGVSFPACIYTVGRSS